MCVKLYRHQQQAISLLAEGKKNLLIIAETGSGKTEVGLAALEQYGRGVYVAPTRALCYEKAKEIEARFPGQRVVIGNKDYSLNVPSFNAVPFRVLTPWKLGVIAENNRDFLERCPVIVVDEIHNLDPDTELILTKVMMLHPEVRIVALSATIHEDDENLVARWLNAIIVKGSGRAVPLMHRIVHFDSDLNEAGEEITTMRVIDAGKVLSYDQLEAPATTGIERSLATLAYIRTAMNDTSPVLIYTPYRERARQIAELVAEQRQDQLPDSDLTGASESLPNEAGDFTDTIKRALPLGIGLHHGGCTAQEREMVYELAREGKLDVIITCQTLAQGINLPARHVIVETVYDEPKHGQDGERQLMNCSTFWQIAGRAGRPQFDKIGYLWVPVGSELERVEVEEVLFKNRASKIDSRVYDEYFLLSQLAGLIKAGYKTPGQLATFMRATFFGAVLQDVEPLIAQFERLINELVTRKFALAFSSRLVLTNRGQRLARLGWHPAEYEAIEALWAENAEYEEWVRRLCGVVAERVIGQPVTEDEIMDVVTYGMTANTVKTSHHVRELCDYLSRLLELTLSWLHLNQNDRADQLRFKTEVADRFQFGTLESAAKLAGVVGRAAVRRVLRNCGPVLVDLTVLDDPQLRSIAKVLWRQTGLPPNGKVGKVAGILGVSEDRLRSIGEMALAEINKPALADADNEQQDIDNEEVQ